MMNYSEIMSTSQGQYASIFGLTIATYVVIFVYLIFTLIFQKTTRLWNYVIHSVGFISEAALLIASIVYYGRSLNAFNKIDIDTLNFIVDNRCSEGPLQYAIEQVTDKYEYQLHVTRLGLAFTIICLILQIAIGLYFSDARLLIGDECCPRKNQSV